MSLKSLWLAAASVCLAGIVAAPPAASDEPAAGLRLTRKETLTGHAAHVHCVAFTPDGRRLVSGSAPDIDLERQNYDTVIAWNLAGRVGRAFVLPVRQAVGSLAVLPGGKVLAVPSEHTVALADLRTGRLAGTLAGARETSVVSVAASPDGKLVAGGLDVSGEILIWDVRTGRVLRTLRGHAAGVISLAFSPDGTQLASGSQDNTARLWNVADGTPRHTLTPAGDDDVVSCVAYAPDGGTLATVTSDGPVHFWNPETGERGRTIPGHEIYAARSAAFSPDGTRLATSSAGLFPSRGFVQLWDVATGAKLAEVEDGDGISDEVAFSPDGKTLASTGGATVKLWEIGPGDGAAGGASPAPTIRPDGSPSDEPPSDLAERLIGTWVVVGTPGDVGEVPETGGEHKHFTGRHFAVTTIDPGKTEARSAHGGTYTVDGDVYEETVEYAPPAAGVLGKTYRFRVKIEGDTLTLTGIGNQWNQVFKRAE